jgi:di/tricarboxylate transporter
VVFVLFGGRELLNRRAEDAGSDPPDPETAADGAGGAGAPAGTPAGTTTRTSPTAQTSTTTRARTGTVIDTADTETVALNPQQVVTLAGLVVLVVGALAFDIDVGLLALSIATAICVLFPLDTKAAVAHVAWPTVLLICGVVTYVSLMERIGTIEMLGNSVADIAIPLLAALVICLIGGAVSAFASTTGILGALIPLAVPFLLAGEVGAVGMIIALAISSSVVDSSPFSTSGALVVASSPEDVRERVFRGLMVWGMSMIIVAPLLAWVIFVAPGWL